MSSGGEESSLVGTHWVRGLRAAFQAAHRFWPRVGDFMEIRSHALKLRWWGLRHEEGGMMSLLDLDYEAVHALPGSGVHELRVDDVIGGLRNIRILFLVPPEDWEPAVTAPLPMIWVLDVLPKKRDDWTSGDVRRFAAKRETVRTRFYDG